MNNLLICIIPIILIFITGAGLYILGEIKNDKRSKEFGLMILGAGVFLLITILFDPTFWELFF